jgi:hypothetical protein
MKSKVMGVDAANRRKNEASGKSKDTPRPMKVMGVDLATANPVNMSGSKDKAPPRRTAKAEIKGYLSKVAREDRETEKAQYKNLDRAMKGTESKAIKEDLRAAREDRMSKPSAPSKSIRPMRSPVKKAMGGMVGYKDGGCVDISGPGNQQVSGKKFSGNY